MLVKADDQVLLTVCLHVNRRSARRRPTMEGWLPEPSRAKDRHADTSDRSCSTPAERFDGLAPKTPQQSPPSKVDDGNGKCVHSERAGFVKEHLSKRGFDPLKPLPKKVEWALRTKLAPPRMIWRRNTHFTSVLFMLGGNGHSSSIFRHSLFMLLCGDGLCPCPDRNRSSWSLRHSHVRRLVELDRSYQGPLNEEGRKISNLCGPPAKWLGAMVIVGVGRGDPFTPDLVRKHENGAGERKFAFST